jgi:hypothetical protein
MQLVRRDVERHELVPQHIGTRDGLSGFEELQKLLLSDKKLCLLDASQTWNGTNMDVCTDPEPIMLSEAQTDKSCFGSGPIGVKDILPKF